MQRNTFTIRQDYFDIGTISDITKTAEKRVEVFSQEGYQDIRVDILSTDSYDRWRIEITATKTKHEY